MFGDLESSVRYSEGWIFGGKHNLIKAIGSNFSTDDEALEFVKKRANEGSVYHQRALAYCTMKRLGGSE